MRLQLAACFLTIAALACSHASGVKARPTVIQITPENGAVQVPLDSAVAVQFSEAMDCADTLTSLAVAGPAGPVPGAATCKGSSLVFRPSERLAVSATYTVTVDVGARDLAGNALGAAFQSSFTTGAPKVTAVVPADRATGVGLGNSVSVKFWEAMDCGTVNAGSMSLITASGDVPGRVVCAGDRASFIPSALLDPSTVYFLVVTSGVRDSAGNALAAFHSQFTTADPAPTVEAVVPDAPPTTMALSEDKRTVYLGGDFRSVGPPTGSLVPLDAVTARPPSNHLKVDGAVLAVAGDGSGGFYIGGTFRRIGSAQRKSLAHILADGSLDEVFKPDVDSQVTALAVARGSVYVGGYFSTLGGEPRARLGVVDAATGAVTSWVAAWSVAPPLRINALAVSGDSVFAGHNEGLGVFDLATGNRNSSFAPGQSVQALAVSGSVLYVGGFFSALDGLEKPRHGLAAIDVPTLKVTDWAPDPAKVPDQGSVTALAVSGDTVYVGGCFTSFEGKARNGLAAVNAATGSLLDWDPNPTKRLSYIDDRQSTQNGMRALAISGSTVYVAGDFTTIGGQARLGLAAVDAADGSATTWNPGPAFGVLAIGLSGSNVLAGGEFYTLGGQARLGLAAIDAATGALTNWNPNAGATWKWGDGVLAIAASGPTVYAGGIFPESGGQARNGLVALDAATGAATPWNPNPSVPALSTPCEPNPCRAYMVSPAINEIVPAGSTIFVGGSFSTIGGQPRTNLASIDAATGLATSWQPAAEFSNVRALALTGTTLYVGADWKNESSSHWGLAALDALTGAMEPDHSIQDSSSFDGYSYVLSVAGPAVLIGGDFSMIGGRARQSLAAIDTASASVSAWDPDPQSFRYRLVVPALAASGAVVYAGGTFEIVGGQMRQYLAALDAATGAATAWNPGIDGSPSAILATESRVYVCGSFTSIGGETRGGFAILPP